jgi:repressor of nif and glnA expression
MAGNSQETDKRIIPILKVLSESSEPIGSTVVSRELKRLGINLSARGVRYHFLITDIRGYTQPFIHDGRILTPRGLEELKSALAPEQIGFVLEKLESLAFQTTFDPQKRSGLVPINCSLVDENRFEEAMTIIGEVLEAGFGVSKLLAIAPQKEKLGSIIVPEGKIGIGTVCSVAVNGVLSRLGIPIESKFGGVLELRNPNPERFVAIIYYNGTSIDPSEQYIRAGMTNVKEAVSIGKGRILANFREIPASSRTLFEEKIARMKEAGIGGVYRLGNTGESVCQISVGLNRVGLVFLGGLNPLAAVREAGIEVENNSDSGLIEFQKLVDYRHI